MDYVGLSCYMFNESLNREEIYYDKDVFGTGRTGRRWSQQLDYLYNHYGHRKPIMVTEGAVSFIDYNTWQDETAFAARSVLENYTYMPIRYPNLKYVIYFNINKEYQQQEQYRLSDRPALLSAYNEALSGEDYITGYTEGSRISHAYVNFNTLSHTRRFPHPARGWWLM